MNPSDDDDNEFFLSKKRDESDDLMAEVVANCYLKASIKSSETISYNKNGSLRKVRRTDYSRGPKKRKFSANSLILSAVSVRKYSLK